MSECYMYLDVWGTLQQKSVLNHMYIRSFVSVLSLLSDASHKIKTSRVALEKKKHFQAYKLHSRNFVNL